MCESIIELVQLTKRYGHFTAVDRLDLKIHKGEIFGLLGPNGAGKSTTILMMLGLTDPTSGTVHVCGTNSTTYPVEVRKKVGYLPEDVGFYDDMTGPENLLYTARLNNIPEQEARQHAAQLLERVGLGREIDKKTGKYSRGMRQRLGLADVLIKNPEVIILDEPTAGQDLKHYTEIMEFLNKEMSNVVLSIDGRKEVHDRMRPFRGGQGSYDLIVPKFQKLAESRHQTNYYVRGTFTHNNLDFSEDVKHLADLGFEQISVEPVVTDPKEPYALRPEDVPQLLEEYDKLAVELLKRQKEGRGVNFFHFMIDLSGGPCVAKRLSGCGSGTEYLAVTPWGDFYPCHQFVGNEKFLMGNVDEGIVRPDIVDEFKCCNVYAKEKCRSCFAKFYCSGGCAANSYNCHGKIDDVYELGCELQKKRVECAIMIKAALADEEE